MLAQKSLFVTGSTYVDLNKVSTKVVLYKVSTKVVFANGCTFVSSTFVGSTFVGSTFVGSTKVMAPFMIPIIEANLSKVINFKTPL